MDADARVTVSFDGTGVADLPGGTHTLAIEATGTRNQSSKGSWIGLDSFDVVR